MRDEIKEIIADTQLSLKEFMKAISKRTLFDLEGHTKRNLSLEILKKYASVNQG